MVKKWRRSSFYEADKDHEGVPEGLGFGIKEERDPDGQLFIYFQLQPAMYVVLGKYTQGDEPYYVSDYTHSGPWMAGNRQGSIVSRHEHLLMAIAKVAEIKEDFERRKKCEPTP